MSKYIKTKHQGVRHKEHPARKYEVRLDRHYFIRFKVDGKDIEEALGWESEWKLQRDQIFAEMERGASDTHVFTKQDGTPYLEAPSAFSTAVEKLGLNEGRAEKDRIVFHSILHSVATRLASRLGPRDLMDVMGWKTVQMAMRYVHGNQDAKLKALSMLGAAPETGKVIPFQKAGT